MSTNETTNDGFALRTEQYHEQSLDAAADVIYNLQEQLIHQIANQINNKLKAIFVESLALKGHVFKSDEELVKFVKANCHAETDIKNQETTYFVKKLPFLKTRKPLRSAHLGNDIISFNFVEVSFL